MKKYVAALYMRLSKDDGKIESSSISNQRKILKRYAEENCFDIYKEYIDDGYSGTSFDRPAWNKMIKDIENGSINTVMVKDLSRIGRDYIISGQYTEIYFPSKGVRLIAVNDGYDSFGGFSDFARRFNSRRTCAAENELALSCSKISPSLMRIFINPFNFSPSG